MFLPAYDRSSSVPLVEAMFGGGDCGELFGLLGFFFSSTSFFPGRFQE